MSKFDPTLPLEVAQEKEDLAKQMFLGAKKRRETAEAFLKRATEAERRLHAEFVDALVQTELSAAQAEKGAADDKAEG